MLVLFIPILKIQSWCKIIEITQENDSRLIAVVCNLQVVDDGDGVVRPADPHGAHPPPGSVLNIELQDVVPEFGSDSDATCNLLYYYTNCIRNNANHEQSQGCHCFVPVTTTLLFNVAPLRPDRGEGRAEE